MRLTKITLVMSLLFTLSGCGLFKGKKDCDCPSWGSTHLHQPSPQDRLADRHE